VKAADKLNAKYIFSLLKQIFWFLLPFLYNTSRTRKWLALTLSILGADIAAATIGPILLKRLADSYNEFNLFWIIVTLSCFMLCWVVQLAAPYGRDIFFFGIMNNAIRDIKFKLIRHIHSIFLDDLAGYKLQEIISSVKRVSVSVRTFMRVSFISVFPDIAKIITLSWFMLFYRSSSLIFILALIVSFGFLAANLRRYLINKIQCWELTDKAGVELASNIDNTVNLRFLPGVVESRLKSILGPEAANWWDNNYIAQSINLKQILVFMIGAFILLLEMFIALNAGGVSIGDILLIKGYITSIYYPMINITRSVRSFFGSAIDLEKIMNIFSLPVENRRLTSIITTGQEHENILSIENLNFSYNGTAVLEGINLSLKKGSKVCLTGPSGTGKTTLCYLAAGLHPSYSGNINFLGYEISEISYQVLGKYIYFLPQEPKFLSGTIRQNLLLEENESLSNSQAEKLIEPIKRSIDTDVNKLSGGEKQRVLLARALELEPSLLIIDEGLRYFDELSMKEIIQILKNSQSSLLITTHNKEVMKQFSAIYSLRDHQLKAV
jgi:ABC-type bacteriocin/lantibiotic exporter with double-glycine peptidase domain